MTMEKEQGQRKPLSFTGGIRLAKRRWILLFRMEGRQKVHLYEPLQKHDLRARLRDGWQEVKEKF